MCGLLCYSLQSVASDCVFSGTGRDLDLGRRQYGETELRSQPAADLFDRLVRLWNVAGAPDEVVLAFGQRMEADVDAGVFRSLCELDGFARQDLMSAVVDHDWRKAGQISVKHVDPGIVPGHVRVADPQLPKRFQGCSRNKRVGLGVAVQCRVLLLHVVPGRNRQDRSWQRDTLLAERYRQAHGKVATNGMADAGDVLGA